MPELNLPALVASTTDRVSIQRTSLGLDVMSRFVCHTLNEAIDPETEPGPAFDLVADFDAIVIGSGMYGAFCATRLVRNGDKVLVLEAGPFLHSDHYQNPPNFGLSVGDNVLGSVGSADADTTNALVWGLPWRGNQQFGRLAFCVGGKSLFWGGWAPRLSDEELTRALPGGAAWPAEVSQYLRDYYERIELQMGVRELTVTAPGKFPEPVVRTELFNNPSNLLVGALEAKLTALVGTLAVGPNGQTATKVEAIEPAPIAVQANSPASGVFAFNKFSALPLLIAASRDDFSVATRLSSSTPDQLRKLFVTPNVRVLDLVHDAASGRIAALRVFDAGTVRTIGVGPATRVVLALSAIESTRLAQASLVAAPRPLGLMGRNLMAHLRNNFSVRIKREKLKLKAGDVLQTAAFNIRCKASNGGRFHFQFYAGFQPGDTAEALLYSSIQDVDTLQALLANQDREWVAITFRGCGEMIGTLDKPTGDDSASYVNLSNEVDTFGGRRAWVNLVQQRADLAVFDEMDEAGFALALALAEGDADAIEYYDPTLSGKKFDKVNPYARGSDRFGKLRSEGGIRDSLGSTYHDSGTLWMGNDPDRSVTDATGRFHDVSNLYCVDQALFPRGGSANPVPTGLLLARRAAEAIANEGLEVVEVKQGSSIVAHHHRAEPGFEPLFVFAREPVPGPDNASPTLHGFNMPIGWKHHGAGSFENFGLCIESRDGIGLLVYEAKPNLQNFVLRLQWRAPTIRNNSGVYVRLPAQHLDDFDKLSKSGYEIQIDNTGERPGDQENFPFSTQLFNPFHQTGAVYPVHPLKGFPAPGDLPLPNGAPSKPQIPTRSLNVWNDLEIVANGNRLRIILNGVETLADGDYVDQRSRYLSGMIALQNHFKGRRVQFRHVRLREM